MTLPVITRVLRKFRDQGAPDAVQDLTGYTIKLIVKNQISDIDARALFDLTASVVTAASGQYLFTFTTVHTCLPAGTYPGEIRWWSGSTSIAPDDAIAVDFIVEEAAKQYP